jgi:hypothetical protein
MDVADAWNLAHAKYDDVGWHESGAMEAGQPVELAFTHIGLYLAWLIHHDLHDPSTFPREHVAAVKAGTMTGSDLADDMDGKLVSDMLTAEGRAFSDYHYTTYLDDYARAFEAEPAYGVEDTEANYGRIAPLLDSAYAAWVGAGRPGPEPDDPNRVIETPAFGRCDGVPDSMTKAEPDAYMDRVARTMDLGFERIEEPMPHLAPDLEAMVVDRLALAPTEVSSVSATHWGSSLLNRSLKRLGVRPRDAIVVSALTGNDHNAVMVALYAVPGASAAALEAEFGSAIYKPSRQAWEPTDVAGRRVMLARGSEFVGIYWAVDGLVFHLGAPATTDLSDLVGRLARD